jgi:hypothetical protein
MSQPDPRTAKAGHYVVVRAGDVPRDEWTALGVICFDDEGRQTFSRFDTSRAIQRGDLPDAESMRNYIDGYAAEVPTLDAVKERRETTAHAMSFIQMTEPRAYLMGFEEGVAQIWNLSPHPTQDMEESQR